MAIILNAHYSDRLELIFHCDGREYPFSFKEEHVYKLSNGKLLFIPMHMKFDFASIPNILKPLFKNLDKCAVAFAVHDCLYITDYKRNRLGAKKARKFADLEMLKILNKVRPESKIQNKVLYLGCRWFGTQIYNEVDTKYSQYYD